MHATKKSRVRTSNSVPSSAATSIVTFSPGMTITVAVNPKSVSCSAATRCLEIVTIFPCSPKSSHLTECQAPAADCRRYGAVRMKYKEGGTCRTTVEP